LLFGGFAAGLKDYKEKKQPLGCGTVSEIDDYIEKDSEIWLGQELFKANCASCHAKNMKADLTGPALGGSIKRLNNDTIAYLSFVQNSGAYIAKGHDKRIVQLYEDHERSVMQAFPNLTKEDIKAIIAYIETRYY